MYSETIPCELCVGLARAGRGCTGILGSLRFTTRLTVCQCLVLHRKGFQSPGLRVYVWEVHLMFDGANLARMPDFPEIENECRWIDR